MLTFLISFLNVFTQPPPISLHVFRVQPLHSLVPLWNDEPLPSIHLQAQAKWHRCLLHGTLGRYEDGDGSQVIDLGCIYIYLYMVHVYYLIFPSFFTHIFS
jgi:hypothetical protein